MKKIYCTLCKEPIIDCNPELSHLKIDEFRSADICPECLDKIIKWQQGIYTRLFPTASAKKMYGKK
ncbi:MAG: hypothetical protein ABIJ34_06360 [archaeon]